MIYVVNNMNLQQQKKKIKFLNKIVWLKNLRNIQIKYVQIK